MPRTPEAGAARRHELEPNEWWTEATGDPHQALLASLGHRVGRVEMPTPLRGADTSAATPIGTEAQWLAIGLGTAAGTVLAPRLPGAFWELGERLAATVMQTPVLSPFVFGLGIWCVHRWENRGWDRQLLATLPEGSPAAVHRLARALVPENLGLRTMQIMMATASARMLLAHDDMESAVFQEAHNDALVGGTFLAAVYGLKAHPRARRFARALCLLDDTLPIALAAERAGVMDRLHTLATSGWQHTWSWLEGTWHTMF